MPTKAKASRQTSKIAIWRKFFTPPIIFATILGIFCAIMIAICFLNPSTKETSVTATVKNMQSLDAVKPRDRLVQTFTTDDHDYSNFGLYYANFSNYTQGGQLHIDVKNSAGQTEQFTYDIGGIIDNTFLYVDYPLQSQTTYTLIIYVSDDAQGITFFTTTSGDYNTKLVVNKQPQDSAIIMAFVSESPDRFAAWYYVMGLTLIACYVVLKINKDIYGQKA